MARKCSVERAERQIGGFARAKKNIVIQYQGRERSSDNLLNLIKQDALNKGIKEEEIAQLDVYVKPEEQSVFYVVNNDLSGQIPF